ncbi:MAG: glycosyltransferase family 2 protein, partial [Muribaculaceae bacterium]|nr:glycosyltransferase family 2 protein [Muribaculaceae bacterium]
VVIPVRNRVKTVGDAIRSALEQITDFPFNVIVVDNHSDDGTTALINEMAAADSRVVHIIPEPGHGIGGCWNVALDSPECGRFAVQLDSDDVYSSPRTLQQIVDKFHATGAACVIGSYTLTDFELNVIPPGLIDHAEWTDANGANNALRINGLGAPRAYYTPVARELRFPDVSYGEDYAMVLRLTRTYRLARIYDSLYFCRRWGGNSDSGLSPEKINANNRYKDWIRSVEFAARKR